MPFGLTGWKKFRRITFPTTMRLAWPAYTNEAIFPFSFHGACLLLVLSRLPASGAMRSTMPANFADRTFNPLHPLPDRGGLLSFFSRC